MVSRRPIDAAKCSGVIRQRSERGIGSAIEQCSADTRAAQLRGKRQRLGEYVRRIVAQWRAATATRRRPGWADRHGGTAAISPSAENPRIESLHVAGGGGE